MGDVINLSASNAHFALGIVIAILLAIYNVPQTYKTYKSKNVEGINYYSFWSLLLGTYLWTIVFSTGTPRNSIGLIIAFTGNILAASLLTVNIALFYWFNKKLSKNQKMKGIWALVGAFGALVLMIILSRVGVIAGNSDGGAYVATISIIAGLNTSLSFLPQIIQSIRKRITQGISLQLVFGYSILNFIIATLWIVDFVGPVTPAPNYTKIINIVLNTMGGLINFIQFSFITYFRYQKGEIKMLKRALS